jgi:cation diffusion facilitator CzcD-associated flavoprotein CzcO
LPSSAPGFGGIASAVRLRRSDIVLLERASDVGGVWRDNDYPGAAVDVESSLYSLSFAPNPRWKNTSVDWLPASVRTLSCLLSGHRCGPDRAGQRS